MVLTNFVKMQNLVNWKNRSSKKVEKPIAKPQVASEPVKPIAKIEESVPEVKPVEPVIEQEPVEEPKTEQVEPLTKTEPKKFIPGMRKIISEEELINFRKTETDENNLKIICGEVLRRAKRKAKKLGIELPAGECDMTNIDQFIDIMLAEPKAEE